MNKIRRISRRLLSNKLSKSTNGGFYPYYSTSHINHSARYVVVTQQLIVAF